MDFSKLNGLVPAVVQDAVSNEVLMVGFMNEEAWTVTRQSGSNESATPPPTVTCAASASRDSSRAGPSSLLFRIDQKRSDSCLSARSRARPE